MSDELKADRTPSETIGLSVEGAGFDGVDLKRAVHGPLPIWGADGRPARTPGDTSGAGPVCQESLRAGPDEVGGLVGRLKELRALSEKATPGPWHATTCVDVWVQFGETGVAQTGDISWLAAETVVGDQATMEANGHLIVAAVNLVRELLASAFPDLLARQRDRIVEERATNQKLHRRVQAVEGPLKARAEKAEWSSNYWRRRRIEVGDKAASFRHRAEAAEARALAAEAIAEERIAAEREACAQIADAFEEENFAMCGDSILLDPVLAKCRVQGGHSVTAEDQAASERHQIDGTIHSSMAHAARNIAAAIRARAVSREGGER